MSSPLAELGLEDRLDSRLPVHGTNSYMSSQNVRNVVTSITQYMNMRPKDFIQEKGIQHKGTTF